LRLIRENKVYVIQNFKVQEATTYRLVDNDLKIVFIFTTSVKVKQPSFKYLKYYFEFATHDILLERENKIIQCLGKSIYILYVDVLY
jgi:hypothetical protein